MTLRWNPLRHGAAAEWLRVTKCLQLAGTGVVETLMKKIHCLAACLGCVLAVTCARAQTPVPPATPVIPSAPAAPDAAARKARVREHVLRKYDANGDGQLDANERAAMQRDRAARLKQYDANGDGKLDPTERAKMRADRKAQKRAARAAAGAPIAPAK